jgi:hypothetical protein
MGFAAAVPPHLALTQPDAPIARSAETGTLDTVYRAATVSDLAELCDKGMTAYLGKRGSGSI